MENHHHRYSNRVFSRLIPYFCRFSSITDVVKSSIIAQKPEKIHQIQSKHCTTAKQQSSSSNSGLFSTEDEKEKVISKALRIRKDNEIDECFSLSSISSLSSLQNISNSRRVLGFSSRRKGEIVVSEMGRSSSSEASTSSSINSYNHLGENPNPRIRVTLADRFFDPSLQGKKRETQHICSESSVFFRGEKHKPEKSEHICSDSFVYRRKTGEMRRKTRETEQNCSNSSVQFRKIEEVYKNKGEMQPKTETKQLCLETRRCSLFIGGKIEESYAVERESRDPYEDFMESMVEMIVEKKISGVKDLEKLLLCFLSLNSSVYHRVILHVFSEICEALYDFILTFVWIFISWSMFGRSKCEDYCTMGMMGRITNRMAFQCNISTHPLGVHRRELATKKYCIKSPPNRPKKSRHMLRGEKSMKKLVRCSRCKQFGHTNKKVCEATI